MIIFLSTDYCLIKNIPWRLRAVIHETGSNYLKKIF